MTPLLPSLAPLDDQALPTEVRSTVWKRDKGRCAFVAPDGRRCAEHGGLEFHHLDPYALGGEATVRNISLRCRAHNTHEAVAWFGSRESARELVPERVEPGLSSRGPGI